ncbi:hypothetical protein ACWEKT_26705 [Nocardia takedensis]
MTEVATGYTTTLHTGHTVRWCDHKGWLRVVYVRDPDGTLTEFLGNPPLADCISRGFPLEAVQHLVSKWAHLRELTLGPWIWAGMTGLATYDATDTITAVRCPSVTCTQMPKVLDHRIAAHHNPATRAECDWTGVRIVPDVADRPPRTPPARPGP